MSNAKPTYEYELRFYRGLDLIQDLISRNARDRMFGEAAAKTVSNFTHESKDCFVCGIKIDFPLVIIIVAPVQVQARPGQYAAGGALCTKCANLPRGAMVERATDAAVKLFSLGDISTRMVRG